MKSLRSLQSKYELSQARSAIDNDYLNLFRESITSAAVAPAAPAAEVTAQDLPEIIDQFVKSIKDDPKAIAELQAAVQTGNIEAVQKLAARHKIKSPGSLEEAVNEFIVHVSTLTEAPVILESIEKFIKSNGNEDILREYDSNYDENLLNLHKEGLGSDIWSGIKKAGKWAGKQLFKYGPWAALGAVAGGPLGAMALPLIAKSLEKNGHGIGGFGSNNTRGYGGIRNAPYRSTNQVPPTGQSTTPGSNTAPTATTTQSTATQPAPAATTQTPAASGTPAPTTPVAQQPAQSPIATQTIQPPDQDSIDLEPVDTNDPRVAAAKPAQGQLSYPPRMKELGAPSDKAPNPSQDDLEGKALEDEANAVKEYRKLRRKGISRSTEDTERMKAILDKYGKDPFWRREARKESFNFTAGQLIKEFHKNVKASPIESAHK